MVESKKFQIDGKTYCIELYPQKTISKKATLLRILSEIIPQTKTTGKIYSATTGLNQTGTYKIKSFIDSGEDYKTLTIHVGKNLRIESIQDKSKTILGAKRRKLGFLWREIDNVEEIL